MNIIYIHGLDSDANSTKGQLLESYCKSHYPNINVYRPDLNQTPAVVFENLLSLLASFDDQANTVLIGSSLGGYFSTLVSNHTGCPAILLNPSTQPHVTLQRFATTAMAGDLDKVATSELVFYTTSGGWAITTADLQWFESHQLSTVNYPNKVAVLIKKGDELLNPELSKDFYQKHGATVTLQEGGDHRFSDFAEHLPKVVEWAQQSY